MAGPRIVSDDAQAQALLQEAVEWAESVFLCLRANVAGAADNGTWPVPANHRHKVTRAILSGASGFDCELAQALNERGALRVADDSDVRTNLLICELNGKLRILMAFAPPRDRQRISPLLYAEVDGDDEFALSIRSFQYELTRFAHIPSTAEFHALMAIRPVLSEVDPATIAAATGQSSSLAELPDDSDLAPASIRTGFLDLDTEERSVEIHGQLLGRGALERDEAIREAARLLRDQGLLQFERLRSGGDSYEGVSDALDLGLKEGLFDRPRRGFVRAIYPEMNDDLWRVCVLSALPPGVAVDREEVCRVAASSAAELFGFEYQRLRRGGRAERAVKRAINSLIRRDIVERSGNLAVRRLS